MLGALGCAGSPIGGKYGLGNNTAGYAEEARVRQQRRDYLAANRAEFNRYCMTQEGRTPAQVQWCMMRQHELDREEDQTERQEDRDAQREREFQAWRRERLTPAPQVNCTSTTDYFGNVNTHCQ